MALECGNNPSSIPTIKITGNSKPFAECKVIRVTVSPTAFLSYPFSTKATFSKKSTKVGNCSATERSSLTFSPLPLPSSLPSSKKIRYPVFDKIKFNRSDVLYWSNFGLISSASSKTFDNLPLPIFSALFKATESFGFCIRRK